MSPSILDLARAFSENRPTEADLACDAYDIDDPKHPAYVDRVLSRVDDGGDDR